MWGRIYPHAVLLTFANIILKASCKGSLTFLIDDTLSMSDDIRQVKSSVNRISNDVFNEKSSVIGNMVLVTFNDPDAQVRVVTENRNTFKLTLDAVYTHNFFNIDCWEPSMNGLLLALDKSNSNSYIYVFTDASAKDYKDGHFVKEMCQKKQSQIVFVLTDRCHYNTDEAFDVYFDIAQACSGLAFVVSKNDVKDVLRTISDVTIKGNKTVITSTTVPAGVKKDIPFTIDDHTDYGIVSVSGRNVYLDIKGPSANLEKIMWNSNGKVAKLSNVKPGTYVATVMGQTKTSVIIVGRTDFFFTHGFSELKPKSLGDTSLQPIADTNVHLSISVTDDHHSVKIVSAQILDMNEKPVKTLPLTEISKDFYVTDPFVAPSERFKIAVNGVVKATGKPLKRIVKIPITPAEPPKILPANTKPIVEIAEGKAVEIEYSTTMKLTCKVVAFPEPKIEWINNNGGLVPSKMSLQEYPYKYISYMDISYASKGDRYKCYAVNDLGRDETTINVFVKEPFTVKSTPSGITKLTYGKEGTVTCDVTSRLPMDIHWYYANEITGQTRQIDTSYKYEVSASRTQLKIKKMDLDLVGRYTCKVSLKNKKDVQKSFTTRVKIDGLIVPKVQGRPEIKVTKGKTAIIECKVVSGLPAPKMTWLFEGKSGSTFRPLAGSETVMHITNVEDKHEGKYKCVAENAAGKNEHVTTLFVQDLPKITTKSSMVYQATEGDALLRIPCVAAGNPKPVIVWKLSGRYITPSAKYAIEDGTLIIRDPKVSDTNSYTCEAKNEAGAVSATFNTYIRQAPKVSGVTAKKVRLGMPASIECTVVGEPKPTITWQFMDSTGSKFLPIRGSDKVQYFPRVENKDAGRYKCVANNGIGSNEHITTLVVEFAPEIIKHSTTVEGTEGDLALRIPCDVVGIPKPVITWKLKGATITLGAKYAIAHGTLIIREPKVSDTNSYTCEAKNEVGAVSATFKTYIRQAPKVSGVTAKKVRLGMPASIECTVVGGLPAPKITWLFGGKSGSTFRRLAGSETVMHITNVEDKHEGKYKCVAENAAGKDEHVTTLFVQDLPKITTKSSMVYLATEGDSLLRIPCVAAGNPKPVIVWKLSGRYITPSAKYAIEDGTLIIRDPKVSDTNSYTCEAKNEAGAVSATFKTYIRQAPKVSGVTAKKVRLGMPASIECTVVGEPKPTILWQFMDSTGSKFLPIRGSDKVLNFPRVENKDAGRYKCVANNGIGSNEHITTLVVEFAPEIIKHSTTVKGTEGDLTLRIPCDVVGIPKPVITWNLKGATITPGAKYAIEDGTLIIRDPKVSDTNSYTCEAKNEVGAVSATFKTYIRQAPKVSGVTAKKVRLGMPASIECTVVGGLPAPKITWLFGGKSGSTFRPLAGSETVMHITNVEDKHEGKYKCVAENAAGKDEHVTTLFVQDLPKITTKSSMVYLATEGDSLLRIPCVAAGNPKPVIVWKLSGRYITPSAKYAIEDGTLIIRDPKVSDTNSYTCEAKNEAGAVSATFKTYIRQAPKVSGVTAKKVRLGMPASIECTVVGEPKPTILWQFMDSTGSKFLPIRGSDKVLNFPRVENKDAGRYKCVANNGIGSNEHITTLVVEFAPEIIKHSTTVKGTEGDLTLRIPCDVVGIPKPVITWNLKGATITPGAKYAIEDGTLIIRDPKVSDTNSYTCEAKNEVGAVSATFKTYIRQAPKVSGVTAKKVRLGMPASIECTVVGGLPAPKITWLFGGKSGSTFRPLAGSETVMHITNVEDKHEGKYKCVAENAAGKDEHVTTLFVQDLPKITTKSSMVYQATEGDALLRIPCVAAGNPKPVIVWKLSGRYITPSAKYAIEDGTLIIRNPKVSDTNSYTCEAKNEVGAVSATFKTYIRQAPKVSGLTAKKVRLGMPASIKCTVEGEPKPTITWQFMDNSGSKFLPIPGSDKVLNFPRVENKHAGRYKCVAKNEIGSNEHITTLVVEFAPEIIKKSTTVEGIEGDLALRIPCDVVGIPKPVITWKLKGATITPDAKYTIEDGALVIMKPTEKDSSLYSCEAKNYISTANTTFEATVTKLPTHFGTEHFVYLLEGETKKLKCEPYSSASQSVKWFITKILQRTPDSSMSTTSSPPELESSETTTASSKDYSSTPWPEMIITTDAEIKEPYIQVTNASFTNHDGNYTCRVSDKHGNTQTHTYVVDVGRAPKFAKELVLNNWTGVISHITGNCDIEKNAKPKPVVEWKFNGKVLTDLNSAGLGHYTCNVSNVHGSVQRTFDVKSSECLITRNLGTTHMQYMPLVLNDKGFWHTLVNEEHFTVVAKEGKITLSCPSQKEKSNTFKNFPKKNTLEAVCYKEESFVVEGKNYKLSDLQCTNSIQPSIIRKKVKCLTETSELLRVGYNVSGFLEAYEVCFDTETKLPLYTRIIMTETNNNGPSAGYNWYTYPGIGNKNTERGFTCTDTMPFCCYGKSQLVNAIDFNDGPAKRSTFIDPLNAIPVWLPCNTSKPSWENINDMVRSLLPRYTEIVAWSGTHTLQEKNGAVIPRYLWKVVRLADDEAVAIVHVNDPTPNEKDIKCKTQDIYDKYDDFFTISDKYTYWCSLPDFFKSFDIHHTDIGETMAAVLQKMEKST